MDDEHRQGSIRVQQDAVHGEGTEAYLKSSVFSREGGRRTGRKRKAAAVYDRADAEVDLIVAMYFDGLSLSHIARMLGRNIDYVSRVFHSPKGRMLTNQRKQARNQLAEELQDRIAYAAQKSLDNIIAMADRATSESVRLRANEYITDKALPQAPRGSVTQVNIGDDAIELALRALAEVDAPQIVEVE
jgi:uncharacterized glyoxalase superfamily protein PhnB